MKRTLLALMILSAACHGDEPKMDENGCWLDAEEAYLTLIETSCTTGGYCNPEFGSDSAIEECIAQGRELMGHYRETLCFDGCTMNTCLERYAAYKADCSAVEGLYYCDDETFYDGQDKACVEHPW